MGVGVYVCVCVCVCVFIFASFREDGHTEGLPSTDELSMQLDQVQISPSGKIFNNSNRLLLLFCRNHLCCWLLQLQIDVCEDVD